MTLEKKDAAEGKAAGRNPAAISSFPQWLAQLLPHHPIFQFDTNGRADEDAALQLPEQRLLLRGTDLFVCSPPSGRAQIRTLCVAELRGAALEAVRARRTGSDAGDGLTAAEIVTVCEEVPYRVLDAGDAAAFPVRALVPLPTPPGAGLVALVGARDVAVAQLPSAAALRFSQRGGAVRVRTRAVGRFFYANDAFNYIADVQWHPAGGAAGVLGVLGSDGVLRVFDLGVSAADPVAVQRIVPAAGFSVGQGEHEPVAFAWGDAAAGAWDAFAVYALTTRGDVFVTCPVLVDGVRVPKDALLQLYVAADDAVRSLRLSDELADAERRLAWVDAVLRAAIPRAGELVELRTPSRAQPPAVQGPCELAPALPAAQDDAAATALRLVSARGWPLLLAAFESGAVAVVSRGCDAIVGAWADERAGPPPVLALVQLVDLQLGAADADDPPGYAVQLFADPHAPHVVYALHDVGVHAVNLSPLLHLLDGRLERCVAPEAADGTLELVAESLKLDRPEDTVLVSELVRAAVPGTGAANPLAGIATASDVFLGHCGLFVAQSGHALCTSLEAAALDAASAGAPAEAADAAVSPDNAAAPLYGHTFEMPAWLVQWTAPRLMPAATALAAPADGRAGAALLRQLERRARELGHVGLHLEDVGDALMDRVTLHRSILATLGQQLAAVHRQFGGRAGVAARQDALAERLLRLAAAHAAIAVRADTVVQLLVDALRMGALGDAERAWMAALVHAVRAAHRYQQDAATLRLQLASLDAKIAQAVREPAVALTAAPAVDLPGPDASGFSSILAEDAPSSGSVLVERDAGPLSDSPSRVVDVSAPRLRPAVRRMMQHDEQLLASAHLKADALALALQELEL